MSRNAIRSICATLASIALLCSCVEANRSAVSGTFQGSAMGHGGPITVETTIQKGKIVSVKLTGSYETQGVGDAAAAEMPKRIVASQNLDVDVVSGATEASQGIIDAVADSVKQSGLDPKAFHKGAAAKRSAAPGEESCDVVVVGDGAAGSAAALSAAEAGAKVILIEKTDIPAGAGTMAGGMFAVGTAAQKAAGKPDASKWVYEQYMKASNYEANGNLVRAIVAESGPTADWLNANGAKLTPVEPGSGGQPAHIGNPAGFMGYVDGGSAAIAALNAKLKEKGGVIHFGTPATSLIMSKDGASVVGVVAKRGSDGATLTIRAASVVLATGGYGGNMTMLKENFGDKVVPGAIASDQGDGLAMAWKAGADKFGERTAQFFFTNPAPEANKMAAGQDIAWMLPTFPFLWVNEKGKRFCNEEVVFDYASMGTVVYEQPDAIAWTVFDQGTVDRMKAKGTVSIVDLYGTWKGRPQRFMEMGELNDTDAYIKQSEEPFDLSTVLSEGEKVGLVVKADKLEDLGAKAGMKGDEFAKTVATYRSMIAAGKDSQFFKDAKYLFPLEKGPYYAFKFTTRLLGTLGGVKIDENIQALNAKGDPIPGLYVAGADAGGMYGHDYVQVEGGTLGFAYTSGRMAGRNAAASALKK
jgi:fumarate reductase flavoprotein subunit